jgi:hypothetical protein
MKKKKKTKTKAIKLVYDLNGAEENHYFAITTTVRTFHNDGMPHQYASSLFALTGDPNDEHVSIGAIDDSGSGLNLSFYDQSLSLDYSEAQALFLLIREAQILQGQEPAIAELVMESQHVGQKNKKTTAGKKHERRSSKKKVPTKRR